MNENDQDRRAEELNDEALDDASGGAIRTETPSTKPSIFTPDPADGRLAEVKTVEPDTVDPAGSSGTVKPELKMTFGDVAFEDSGPKR